MNEKSQASMKSVAETKNIQFAGDNSLKVLPYVSLTDLCPFPRPNKAAWMPRCVNLIKTRKDLGRCVNSSIDLLNEH